MLIHASSCIRHWRDASFLVHSPIATQVPATLKQQNTCGYSAPRLYNTLGVYHTCQMLIHASSCIRHWHDASFLVHSPIATQVPATLKQQNTCGI